MAFDYANAYQQFINEELAAIATAWILPPASEEGPVTGAGMWRFPP